MKKSSKLLLVSVAIVMTIITLFFAKSRFIHSKLVSVEINFYEYRILDTEIVVEPEIDVMSEVQVTITSSKAGLTVQYQVGNDTEWLEYTAPFIVDENNVINVKYVGEKFSGPITSKEITNIIGPAATTTVNGEETAYFTVQEAIDAGGDNSGAVVTLVKDEVIENVTVAEGQDIILDLNGNTLTEQIEETETASNKEEVVQFATVNNEIKLSNNESGNIAVIQNNGKLRIKDSKGNTANGGKLVATGATTYSIENNNEIVIESGNISSSYRGILNNENGKLEVAGGNIETSGVIIYNSGVADTVESPAVKISGGTLNNTENQAGIWHNTTGLVYVTGGTIDARNHGIRNSVVGSKVVVTGGTINSREERGITAVDDTIIEVSGGNIVGKKVAIGLVSNGTINITGGTITGEGMGISLQSGNLTVSGETTKISGATHGITIGQGTAIIADATIEATEGVGVHVNLANGMLTLGTKEDDVQDYKILPAIIGKTNGVQIVQGTFNYYDGTIEGAKGQSVSGTITELATDHAINKTVSKETDESEIETTRLVIPGYEEYNSEQVLINSYATLALALSGAENNSTIKPIKGIEETQEAIVAEGKTLTLDFNGKTTILNNVSLVNNGNLTVLGDSGKITSNVITIKNNGNLKVSGNCEIEGTGEFTSGDHITTTSIVNYGKLDIDGGNIITTKSHGVYNAGEGEVYVKNGNITTGMCAIRNGGTKNTEENPAVIIENGNFVSTAGNTINNDKGAGLVVINGGEISRPGDGATPTVINYSGKIIINGGNISSEANRAVLQYLDNGTIEIHGGTCTGSVFGAGVQIGELKILGGTIIGGTYGVDATSATATLTIGSKDNKSNTTIPVIQSTNIGVRNNVATFNFYDGIIKGDAGKSIAGTVNDKEEGYEILKGTETIEGTTYETATLYFPIDITYDENYYSNNLWEDTTAINKYKYWSASPSSVVNGNLNTAHNGQYVKATMNAGAGGMYYATAESLVEGKEYTWSVYVKANRNIQLYNIGHEQGGAVSGGVTLNTEWKKVTYTFTATAKTEEKDNFVFFASAWNSGDEIYIHSLEIMEGKPTHNIVSTTENKQLGTLTTPVRTGYTFDGWYTKQTGGEKVSSTTVVLKQNKVTYYAHWIVDSFTVKIDPNGGTYNGSTNTITQTNAFGSKVSMQVPTRTGYTFGGWVPTKVAGTDDSTWVEVFYHNVNGGKKLFTSDAEVLATNSNYKYSILGQLEKFRYTTDSEFEFLLEYEELPGQYNRWKQTSNPTTSTTVTGYAANGISWTEAYWGGLAKSTNEKTFIDGAPGVDTWYYAIGVNTQFEDGIPAVYNVLKTTDKSVTLWVKANSDLSNILENVSGVIDENKNYTVKHDITLKALWIPNNYQNTTSSEYYPTLEMALRKSATGTTVKALNNVTEVVAATVEQGKSIKVDLNGKTITFNNVGVTNNGTLEVTGTSGTLTSNRNTITNSETGTFTKTGACTITGTSDAYTTFYNLGTATLSAGTISGSKYNAVYNQTTGKLTVSGATLTSPRYTIANYGTATGTSTPAVKITSGTVKSTGSNAILNGAAGTVYATGGTIEGASVNTAIYNTNTGLIQISGATVKNTSTATAINNGSTGKINVTSGTVIAAGNNAIYNNSTGEITISGGTITSNTSVAVYNKTGKVTISGGTITSKVQAGVYTDSGTIQVTGGTIFGGTDNTERASGILTAGGTVTIGTNETTPSVSVTTPNITGSAYGVNARGGTFNYYDGIIKGVEEPIAGKSTQPDATPTGYVVVAGTKTENNITYKTAVLGPSAPVITAKYTDANGSAYTSGTWTNKNVYISLKSANVGKGIKQYEWKEGSDGTWQIGAMVTSNNVGTGTYSSDRNSTIYFRAIDNNDVVSATSSIIIRKETTAPTVNAYAGVMLYNDPTFASGVNSIKVYNNMANGTVTHTRKVMSDSPTGSGYGIEIKTTGEARMNNGGFYFGTNSAANKHFVTRIIAKIPEGYTLEFNTNETGTGRYMKWFTTNKGTGKWQEYICELKCGASGTFSTTNFYSVKSSSGSIPTPENPLIWQLAYATVIDTTITGTQNYIFASGTDNDSGVAAYGINQSDTTEPTWTTISQIGSIGIASNKITSNGNYYVWVKDGAGNIAKKLVTVSNVTTTSASALNVSLDDEQVSLNNTNVLSYSMGSTTIQNTTNQLEQNIQQQKVQIGNSYYATLQEAINASNNSDTIELLQDVSLTEEAIIEKDKNINIKLNGKTLTSTSINTISNKGTLTITSNGIIKNEFDNGVVINNTGTVSIEDAIITTEQNGGKGIYNDGELTMISGKIITEGIGANAIYNSKTAKTIIEGGILEVRGFGSKAIYNNSEVTVVNKDEGKSNEISTKVVIASEDSIGIYNSTEATICNLDSIEIKLEAEEIENYELIKNTDEFKEELEQMKPSYGIFNDSNIEVNVEEVVIKVERLKGVGILNNLEGSIILGTDDETLDTSLPIIYAISDNTIAMVNTNVEKGKIKFYDGTINSVVAVKNIITDILENYEIVENIGEKVINTTLKKIEEETELEKEIEPEVEPQEQGESGKLVESEEGEELEVQE